MKYKVYVYTVTPEAIKCHEVLRNYHHVIGYVEKNVHEKYTSKFDLAQKDYDLIYLPNANYEEERNELIEAGVPEHKIRIHFRYATTGYLDQEKLLGYLQNPLIFDVGGNVGQTILRYKNLFPEATIHSFEPNPDIFPTLKENEEKYRHVFTYNLAVGSREGEMKFYKNDTSIYSSPYPMNDSFNHNAYVDEAYEKESEVMMVPMTTLTNFTHQQGIEHIDILKMDIQGGEIEALKGFEKYLEEQRIDIIYTELCFQEIYTGQPLIYDIGTFLNQHGYVLYTMYHFMKKQNMPILFCDGIFISQQVLKRLEQERIQMLARQKKL